MKTIAKRIVMALYCKGLINSDTTMRIFERLQLWKA